MSTLNIRTKTMFGTYHSWAVTMRSLFHEFIEMGHNPHIMSMNTYSKVPKEWEASFDKEIEDPDLDICYTAPLNFGSRFAKNAKVKAAIYNFETIPLPEMWSDSHKHLDFVLPSSNFSKEVFLEAGWPDEKLVVIPHGVNLKDFEDKRVLELNNQKKFRFLNVSIPHYRKNIPLLVDAYYKAFSSKDDVCLVLKTKFIRDMGKKKQRFDIDLISEIEKIQKKYVEMGRDPADLPQIELLEKKLPTMIPLYNACDCLVSASSAEGFGLPLLEALASDMLVIAPNATGQKDFLNDRNSLLVDVATTKATPEYQYWAVSKRAWTYMPIRKSLVENMRRAYESHKYLKNKFNEERLRTINEFTWNNAAKKILELV